jgi:hypothetical protein
VLKMCLHVKFVAQELGIKVTDRINLQVDAISFSNGGGVRMKHIDARLEWVQSLRDKNVVRLIKVDGFDNEADMYTKILTPPEFKRQMLPKKKLKTANDDSAPGEGMEDDMSGTEAGHVIAAGQEK